MISPEKRNDRVNFFPADKNKSFLQIDSITLGLNYPRMSKVQKKKKNKFPISLQYPKENLKDEVELLPADKH